MEQTPQTNPLAGLPKQKLYSLIVAGVALISIFLPWITIKLGMFGNNSVNGLRSWGILSLLSVGVVAAACFMGDKSKEFDSNTKKIALGGFGGIAAGALLFFIRKSSYGGVMNDAVGTGFGLWLCLLAGIAGLAWVYGLIKLK
jgi:hypothetical protein